METSGVFPYLANTASFVDRIDISLYGERRRRIAPPIQILRNPAIGGRGEGRFYARCIHCLCGLGGNPVELRYGRTRPFPSVPPLRLILRAHETPLSAAQVVTVRDLLVRRGFRSHISSLELTSDLRGVKLCEVCRRLIIGRRSIRKFKDEAGHETVYLASPTSPWQFRAYQKTDEIIRLEFVLRRSFLRHNGICEPSDVLKLENLGLWRMILPPCRERRILRAMHRHLIW